ncbi:hypothetical protein BDF19DRAFT_428509 [Syncephalis fuscata]|nr:hypothetical protein BDF19DRAFT_428509 [Syncephalis fuscata]
MSGQAQQYSNENEKRAQAAQSPLVKCTGDSKHPNLTLSNAYFYFPPQSGQFELVNDTTLHTHILHPSPETGNLLVGMVVFKIAPIIGPNLHEVYAAVAFDTGLQHEEPPQMCGRILTTERGFDFNKEPNQLRTYYDRAISHSLRPLVGPQFIQGKLFNEIFMLKYSLASTEPGEPFALNVELLQHEDQGRPRLYDVEYMELPYPSSAQKRESAAAFKSDLGGGGFLSHSLSPTPFDIVATLDTGYGDFSYGDNEQDYVDSGYSSVTIRFINNHPDILLTNRHQYTHKGTVELETNQTIPWNMPEEYKVAKYSGEETSAIIVFEVKAAKLASQINHPYDRLFLAVAGRHYSQQNEEEDDGIYDSGPMTETTSIDETCTFLFRTDSPNFPERDLLLQRLYEHQAVHLFGSTTDAEPMSWIYSLDNQLSFIVKSNSTGDDGRVAIDISIDQLTLNNTDQEGIPMLCGQTPLMGPILNVSFSGFSWHCSNAFDAVKKEISSNLSWKEGQFIQLIENATQATPLELVQIWSSKHLKHLPTSSSQAGRLKSDKFELRHVTMFNSSEKLHYGLYQLEVAPASTQETNLMCGPYLLVHHDEYATASTDQEFLLYFGAMISVYQNIYLNDSASVVLKAFRTYPEVNEKMHIVKPAVVTLSVLDHAEYEHNKSNITSFSDNSSNTMVPYFRIHHNNQHTNFSLDFPSICCVGYNRKHEDIQNKDDLLVDADDVIQYKATTTDATNERVVFMEYQLLDEDSAARSSDKIRLFSHIQEQSKSEIVVNVELNWHQGERCVSGYATMNTNYQPDNNDDGNNRHLLVEGYIKDSIRCFVSIYLFETPAESSYDVLFLTTNSLAEMRGIMRTTLDKLNIVDCRFDEPIYPLVMDNTTDQSLGDLQLGIVNFTVDTSMADATETRELMMENTVDQSLSKSQVKLTNAILYTRNNNLDNECNLDLEDNQSINVPTEICEHGCVVWRVDLTENTADGNNVDIATIPHYIGLVWKTNTNPNVAKLGHSFDFIQGQASDNANETAISTAVYMFTSEEPVTPNKMLFMRILMHMDPLLSGTNDSKFTYVTPTGQQFGISVKIVDESLKSLCVQLYQQEKLVTCNSVDEFTSLEGVVLSLPKCLYGFNSKESFYKMHTNTKSFANRFSVVLEKTSANIDYELIECWTHPQLWKQSKEWPDVVLSSINVICNQLCKIYKISYKYAMEPCIQDYLVLGIVGGQIGVTVVKHTMLQNSQLFVSSITRLLRKSGGIQAITPLIQFEQQFDLDSENSLHIRGYFTPGKTSVVHLSTLIKPINLTQVANSIPLLGSSTGKIQLAVYNFNEEIDIQFKELASTGTQSDEAQPIGLEQSSAAYCFTRSMEISNALSTHIQFDIMDKATQDIYCKLDINMQEHLSENNLSEYVEASCMLIANTKQEDEEEEAALDPAVPGYTCGSYNTTVRLEKKQNASSPTEHRIFTEINKMQEDEEVCLVSDASGYNSNLYDTISPLNKKQAVPLSADYYKSTEIYTRGSNRCFATVYLNYTQSTGLNCIVVLTEKLDEAVVQLRGIHDRLNNAIDNTIINMNYFNLINISGTQIANPAAKIASSNRKDKTNANNSLATTYDSGDIKDNGIILRIWMPDSSKSNRPIYVNVNKTAMAVDVIGYVIAQYTEKYQEPELKDKLDPSFWNIQITGNRHTDTKKLSLTRLQPIQEFGSREFNIYLATETQRLGNYAIAGVYESTKKTNDNNNLDLVSNATTKSSIHTTPPSNNATPPPPPPQSALPVPPVIPSFSFGVPTSSTNLPDYGTGTLDSFDFDTADFNNTDFGATDFSSKEYHALWSTPANSNYSTNTPMYEPVSPAYSPTSPGGSPANPRYSSGSPNYTPSSPTHSSMPPDNQNLSDTMDEQYQADVSLTIDEIDSATSEKSKSNIQLSKKTSSTDGGLDSNYETGQTYNDEELWNIMDNILDPQIISNSLKVNIREQVKQVIQMIDAAAVNPGLLKTFRYRIAKTGLDGSCMKIMVYKGFNEPMELKLLAIERDQNNQIFECFEGYDERPDRIVVFFEAETLLSASTIFNEESAGWNDGIYQIAMEHNYKPIYESSLQFYKTKKTSSTSRRSKYVYQQTIEFDDEHHSVNIHYTFSDNSQAYRPTEEILTFATEDIFKSAASKKSKWSLSRAMGNIFNPKGSGSRKSDDNPK